MDQQGRLTQWNDAKGYEFITPLSRGPRIFVHISQFQQRDRRPSLNDLLTYEIGHDEQGRYVQIRCGIRTTHNDSQ
jgi:cold shock CspA family protein